MTKPDSEGRPDLSALKIDDSSRGASAGSRRVRWILAAAGAVVVLLFAAMALRGRARVEVATASPAGGPEAATVLNASGYVTPRRRATVAAKITGRVKEVLVDEGMQVQEGQVLAILDDSDARAASDAAVADRAVAVAAMPALEANLKEAGLTLERNRALVKDGFVDQQSLDRAQAAFDSLSAQLAQAKEQVKAAQARIEVAQRDLDNCVVRAPFAGIAVSKDAQPGEMVSPISAGGGFTRTGISTIVDMASLEIEVDVNESSIAKVVPGQKVLATLDAYPDWEIPCSVRTVIPTADRQKATVKVRIAFDRLDPKILPDMGVKVAFLGAEAPRGTPGAKALIPLQAVREEKGEKVVYVLKGDRLSRRPVVAGKTLGSEAEIMSGVDPGDSVVTAGPARLKDGQRAEIGKR
jgi:RND family efflux transporter MFP subunit